MKYIIITTILITFSKCRQSLRTHEKIYPGKSYINLCYGNGWIIANRVSRWNNKLIDTPVISPFRSMIDISTGNFLEKRYIIQTMRGQQYNFLIPGKFSVWLNAATMFGIIYENDRLISTLFAAGVGFIETLDSVTVNFDSLTINISKGSWVNLENRSTDSMYRVSLIRGAAQVQGKYGACSISTTLFKPGLQLAMSKLGAVGYFQPIDTVRILSWRNAQYLVNDTVNLSTLVQQVADWYNIEININSDTDKNRRSKGPLTIAHSTSLSTVLGEIEQAFDIHVRKLDSTYFIIEH